MAEPIDLKSWRESHALIEMVTILEKLDRGSRKRVVDLALKVSLIAADERRDDGAA